MSATTVLCANCGKNVPVDGNSGGFCSYECYQGALEQEYNEDRGIYTYPVTIPGLVVPS